MSTIETIIIDYGLGNLFNVKRALEYTGCPARISSDPKEVSCAQRLILPGVGAFGAGMQGLRERNLISVIRDRADTGCPILAICLGMQLLFRSSEEMGHHEGLGIIPGRVVPLKPSSTTERFKIPHIGWSALLKPGNKDWKGTVLADQKNSPFMYFVHSFIPVPEDPQACVAMTEYGGTRFCSVIQKERVVGLQGHPERSGAVGLKIFEAFLNTGKENSK